MAGAGCGAVAIGVGWGAGDVAAGSPVLSTSSNCVGSDAWVATLGITSDDPTGNWRLDAPFPQPPGGGYQPETSGFVVEQTSPLDVAEVTVRATVSWEAGGSQEVSAAIARPDVCVAPPSTDPPVTDPPSTDPPSTDPPVTDPPSTDPPVTDPPSTDPPSTDPPVSSPPVAAPPADQNPGAGPPAPPPTVGSTAPARLPETGDTSTVLVLLAVFCTSLGLLLQRFAR